MIKFIKVITLIICCTSCNLTNPEQKIQSENRNSEKENFIPESNLNLFLSSESSFTINFSGDTTFTITQNSSKNHTLRTQDTLDDINMSVNLGLRRFSFSISGDFNEGSYLKSFSIGGSMYYTIPPIEKTYSVSKSKDEFPVRELSENLQNIFLVSYGSTLDDEYNGSERIDTGYVKILEISSSGLQVDFEFSFPKVDGINMVKGIIHRKY